MQSDLYHTYTEADFRRRAAELALPHSVHAGLREDIEATARKQLARATWVLTVIFVGVVWAINEGLI